MNKDFYQYNENLILTLGYRELENKYSLFDDNINKSIYFAVTSFDEHIKATSSTFLRTREILLGDFFSFEYYAKFLNNLDKLFLLSATMKKNYLLLLKKDISDIEVLEIAISLPKLLLNLYNRNISNVDKIIIATRFFEHYKKYDAFFLKKEIQVEKLIEEFGEYDV